MEELPIEVGGGRSTKAESVVSVGGRRPGRFVVGALVIVVALAVVLGSHRSLKQQARATTTVPLTTVQLTTVPAVPTSVTVPTSSTTRGETTTAAERVVEQFVGPLPILGAHTGTELIVLTRDSISQSGLASLVRISLDKGGVTRTRVPLASTGPTFVVSGLRSVLIRPIDFVSAFVVPDGGVAQQAAAPFDTGTDWAYPGPRPGVAWLPEAATGLPLVVDFAFDGSEFTPNSVGTLNLQVWGPDGTGQLVLTGVGGSYVTTDRGLTRITTGDVFAAGPNTWLARECDDHHLCRLVKVDRRSGTRTPLAVLDWLANDAQPVAGVITADGESAVIMQGSPPRPNVVDLITGSARSILPANVSAYLRPVWSFDSRFLFVVNDSGTVSVYDRKNDDTSKPVALTELPIPLTNVAAIAVRPAP